MLEQGHPALSPNISNNRHLALTAGLLLEQIRGKWTLTFVFFHGGCFCQAVCALVIWAVFTEL